VRGVLGVATLQLSISQKLEEAKGSQSVISMRHVDWQAFLKLGGPPPEGGGVR